MANKKKFRITINTLTSWGASVVIIGVMAKLLRWHGADTLIIVGMLTEAILFFILGFQSDEIKVVTEEGERLPGNAVLVSNSEVIAPAYTASAINQPALNTPNFSIPDTTQYQEEMDKMTEHLKNLNAAYQNMTADLNNVESMAAHTTRVKEESEKLAKNLTALNSVYRNMLNAMNMPNA